MLIKFVLSIIFSALISAIITPVVRNYFVSRRWVEDPSVKQKKTHNATATTIIPRGGGVAIFASILITSLVFLVPDRHLIGILLAAAVALIIGLWDDVKDISPLLRLGTNLLVGLIVVGSGIGIAYISNPFGGVIDLSVYKITFDLFGTLHQPWILADIFALIWITWCMNIVGWSAGVEGQLPGFVAVSAIFIGILGLSHSQDISQWPVIILAGTVAGAYLGFLPYNFYPQSIMPGYSGKSLAGFFLAVLAILSGAKVATLILVLGIPTLDAFFVILKRLLNHQPILVSDSSHFHHLLLKSGWSRSRIAVLYWSISLCLGLISLFLNSQQKFYAFIGLAILFLGTIIRFYRRT
jgi:UDP-GlcNAc:undecaprenyl-phosphate GlcNAc-1-phosphate transferase